MPALPAADDAHSWYDDEYASSGGGGVAIASSARDSTAMVLAGLGIAGQDEIELRVGRGDRALIEGVIEALGKVCCELEAEGAGGRAELRERLRGAMQVLEGQDPYGEMF